MAFVYNWTKKDFTYPWGKIPYTLQAGKVYQDVLTADDGMTKILIEKGIAQHFAKHLADREMSDNEEKLPQDQKKVAWNMAVWETFCAKALTLPPAVSESIPVAMEDIKKNVEPLISEQIAQEPRKKMGRPPKAKVEEIPAV